MRIPFLSPRVPSEAESNAASIHSVPLDELPIGPARSFLLSEALDGKDVYAYLSGGPGGIWNVWYGPLVPRYDARIPARTWHQFWPAMATLVAKYEARRQEARAAVTQDATQANGFGKGGAA